MYPVTRKCMIRQKSRLTRNGWFCRIFDISAAIEAGRALQRAPVARPLIPQQSKCRAHDRSPASHSAASGPMEKILMLWDEADDLVALAPRVLAATAAVVLIIAAAFIDRLWPLL